MQISPQIGGNADAETGGQAAPSNLGAEDEQAGGDQDQQQPGQPAVSRARGEGVVNDALDDEGGQQLGSG